MSTTNTKPLEGLVDVTEELKDELTQLFKESGIEPAPEDDLNVGRKSSVVEPE